eukprot:CAMPEP_0168570708 /NCGR_PEP_ID=MMETSP0413-20121227/16895_1 /TAXON_ID=136452 /ORGANISM="Filamoeba nolandi, Strain NC-AS-23-1" /LENGTH=393 /DNA_ID=CAMNT_0008603409 /DNA_START=34 /DNA_END=1215 /DNA_ORIENTATION=+
MSSNTKEPVVYHEKQVAGLCGVHCLNSLLQGPYFTEVDLMLLGKELDDEERKVMAELGHDTKDFLKFMSEDSGNVADDGNFSVQVLQRALHKKKLDCEAVTKDSFFAVLTSLDQHEGFILNKGNHWFAIRKIHNNWFDFNSCNKKPKYTDVYALCHEMESLVQKGYAVYVVKGKLPEIPVDKPHSNDGRWLKMKTKGSAVDVESDDEDDADLRKALEQSLKEKAAIVETYKDLQDSIKNLNLKQMPALFAPGPSQKAILQPQHTHSPGNSLRSSSNAVPASPLKTSSETIVNTPPTTSIPKGSSGQPSQPVMPAAPDTPLMPTPAPLVQQPPGAQGNVGLSSVMQEQMTMMQQYFTKCVSTMERLEQRLSALESNIQRIAQIQHQKKVLKSSV